MWAEKEPRNEGKASDFSGGRRIAWNTPHLPYEDGINGKRCMLIFGKGFGGQVFSFSFFSLCLHCSPNYRNCKWEQRLIKSLAIAAKQKHAEPVLYCLLQIATFLPELKHLLQKEKGDFSDEVVNRR